MKDASLSELRAATAGYMRKLQFSESRIVQAGSAWNHLERYMEQVGHESFGPHVAEGFDESVLAGRPYEQVPRWDRDKIVLVGMLVEMQSMGRIKYRRDSRFVALTGPIAHEVADFMSGLRGRGMSRSTMEGYRATPNRFSQFMDAGGVDGIGSVTAGTVITFVEMFAFASECSRKGAATHLRAFLRRAYDEGLTDDDLSRHVPRIRRVRQPALPSVYSQDEVEKVLGAVDRASAKGKRDYAMMMLAARLGLRASDICGLTFPDLDWRSSMLRITQLKTGEPLDLPLLPDVGGAVIDYIRYARPESELPYVFLHVVRPFDRICSSTLSSVVTQCVNLAGVDVGGGRRHGPHALRHSLAARLLDAQTPLPVISAVLGHTSSESTRYYLRVDESALRRCALEVPEVATW